MAFLKGRVFHFGEEESDLEGKGLTFQRETLAGGFEVPFIGIKHAFSGEEGTPSWAYSACPM